MPPNYTDQSLTFADMMELTPHGTDVWVGAERYPWDGRIYGGQVVASGLLAASKTVEEPFTLHSVHAYFIRGGATTEPVRYEVDRIRNGRSFCTRRVVARQSGGAILNLAASYQVPEDEAEVDVATPPRDVPPVEDIASNGWGFVMDRRTIDYPPHARRASGYVRITDAIPNDPALHQVGLAFTSDTMQFGAIRTTHPDGDGTFSDRDLFMGASLDHAIWFHKPVDPSRWHLYDFTSKGMRNGRGLAIGEVFDDRGVHVATVAQELLLRLRRER